MNFPIINVCFQLTEDAKIGQITIPKANYVYFKGREIQNIWSPDEWKYRSMDIFLSQPMTIEEYLNWLDSKKEVEV